MGLRKYRPLPTQAQLLEQLRYEPDTGHLYWIVPFTGTGKGKKYKDMTKPAGFMTPQGYSGISVQAKPCMQHRVIWLMVTGEDPGDRAIDHKNGNRKENIFTNLRLVDGHTENAQNQKRRNTNTSGVTGVSWCKRRNYWAARIKANGKNNHLGYYDDWFEAVCARKSANNKYGFHPNHGR